MGSACAAARLATKPQLLKAGETLTQLATSLPLRELRQEVRSREEAARQGTTDPLLPVSFLASEETLRAFRRARDLASVEAKTELSDGQAFAVVTHDYVRRHDPLRVAGRARRVGPTAERPRDRYVPVSEARKLYERSGLHCEVPGCTRVATEKCHVRPHAKGSGREASDVFEGCPRHHVLYDAGILEIRGWTDEGRPIFATRDGQVLGARPAPAENRRAAAAAKPTRERGGGNEETGPPG